MPGQPKAGRLDDRQENALPLANHRLAAPQKAAGKEAVSSRAVVQLECSCGGKTAVVRFQRLVPIVSLALALAALAVPAGAAQVEIVINLPAFTLYLYEDGVVTKTYPIGIGSTVNPSQLGTTQIINEVHHPTYYPPDWYRKGLEPIPPGPDNPVGTRWLGLGFKGYGIHGTNQPWTIGTAASAGCIRMYNADVEDLADRVGVGVPVTFMYETIEAWVDPLTHRPQIKVYRDVYRQGTNGLERALASLERIGAAQGVDVEFLQAILQEEAGVPRAVPYAYPLYLDERQLSVNAVEYGGRLLISLHGLARLFDETVSRSKNDRGQASVGGRVVAGSFYVGDKAYAPVEEAAAAFGLMAHVAAGEVRLQSVRLVADALDVSNVRAYVYDQWLLVPVQELGRRLGIDVAWDPAAQAVTVDGRPAFGVTLVGGRAYLSHDRVESLLGVRIVWTQGAGEARLIAPRVTIPGSLGEEQAFFRDGHVYVPLRYVADHFGYTLGWNRSSRTAYLSGVPVEGIVRNGRVYTSLAALTGILTGLEYTWDEERLQLELRRGALADPVAGTDAWTHR